MVEADGLVFRVPVSTYGPVGLIHLRCESVLWSVMCGYVASVTDSFGPGHSEWCNRLSDDGEGAR